jgi:predicted metal-dependent enzyme (double-stranded beta helix superfamily)
MTANHPERDSGGFDLERFVARATAAARAPSPMGRVEALLAEALTNPGAIARAIPPSDEVEVILHQSPELTVFHIELDPGTHYPPHSHGMHAAIGMYRGSELNVFYERGGPGLVERARREIMAGETSLMHPNTIHSVANPGSERSAAIHVYLGELPAVARSLWNPSTFEEHAFDDDLYFAFGRPLTPA